MATPTVHYAVVSTRGGEEIDLENALSDIAAGGGRVVSVVWAPARTNDGVDMGAGYVIIGEYPGP